MFNKNKSKNIQSPNPIYLHELLGVNNRLYEIPLFQRNYNWNVNNCRELYDDIINSFIKERNYFIGIFIHYLSNYESNKTVSILIDGQQRLTTIMLLLCAIRDVTDNQKLKKDINNHFIYNSNKDIPFRFKLKQNNFDNDIFEKIMSEDIESINEKSNIYKNYSKILEWVSLDSLKYDLNDLYEHITNLESVEIILDNNDITNVQEIFEKINSTGQELSAADLVRNYLLFTGNGTEQEKLYNKWTYIEKIVGSSNITKFIKAYTVRYSYDLITSSEIYKKFKEQFKDRNHNEILDDMIDYALYYSIINNNLYYKKDSSYNLIEESSSDEYNDTSLKLLDSLGTDDLIPLFLQVYSKLYNKNNNKIREIIELILEFMIRYRIVQPSSGGGALNNKIWTIMKKIENKECPLTAKGIYDLLSKYDSEATRYPTDSQFINSLKEGMLVKNGRVLLYQFARRKKNEISDFDKNITLEHLMPQEINPEKTEGKWWISNLGKTKYQKIQEDYTDCIGNYALLTRSLNASISNGPWPEKRKAIKERAFDEKTREVANQSKWNENTILERNEKFSAEIAKIITGPKSENKNKKWLV